MRRGWIYGVDFDGTLCEEMWPDIGEPNIRLIEYLKKRKNLGDRIILITMREGIKLDEAIKWCKNFGLTFDAINDNLPELKGFYGGNPRKIFANEYIDDHNSKDDWSIPYHPFHKT